MSGDFAREVNLASTEHGATADRQADTTADSAAGRVRSVTAAALAEADTVADNRAERDIDAELLRGNDSEQFFGADDFRPSEESSEGGESDDDEPLMDEEVESTFQDPVLPRIRFYVQQAGAPGFYVEPVTASSYEDDNRAQSATLEASSLDRIAAGIRDDLLTGIDLRADLSQIWDDLSEVLSDGSKVTKAAMESRWKVRKTYLTDHANLLIGLPRARVVPVDFFFWKAPTGKMKGLSADTLVKQLAGRKGLENLTKADVERRFPRNARYASELFYWVRAVRFHPDLARRARDMFNQSPWQHDLIIEDLATGLVLAERERAIAEGLRSFSLAYQNRLPVLHRTLAGGIR